MGLVFLQDEPANGTAIMQNNTPQANLFVFMGGRVYSIKDRKLSHLQPA
jgi:hypothetical protein